MLAHAGAPLRALSRPAASLLSHKPVTRCSLVQIRHSCNHRLTQKPTARLTALSFFVAQSGVQRHFISLMRCQVMVSLAKCLHSSLIKSFCVISCPFYMRRYPALANIGGRIVILRALISVLLSLPIENSFPPPLRMCMRSMSQLLFPFHFAFHTLPLVHVLCASVSPFAYVFLPQCSW